MLISILIESKISKQISFILNEQIALVDLSTKVTRGLVFGKKLRHNLSSLFEIHKSPCRKCTVEKKVVCREGVLKPTCCDDRAARN